MAARATNLSIGTNDYLCRYGRVTGDNCGRVTETSTSLTYRWEGCGWCFVTAHDFVMVDTFCITDPCLSQPGDSGGPWYAGSKAFGVHFGNLLFTEAFSKIENAEIYFGVFVQTD